MSLTIGAVSRLTDIGAGQIRSLAQRDQLPQVDNPHFYDPTDDTKDKHGWRRFSAFDALLLAVQQDFVRAHGVPVADACNLAVNAAEHISKHWARVFNRDPLTQLWTGAIGLAIESERGTEYSRPHVAGSLAEISAEIAATAAECPERQKVYRLILVNASQTFQAFQRRAAAADITLPPVTDPDAWREVARR